MNKPAFHKSILIILLAASIVLFAASWMYRQNGIENRNAVRATAVVELRDAIYNYVYDNAAYPGCLKTVGVVAETDIQRCRSFVEDLTSTDLYIANIPMDKASNGWESGFTVTKGTDNQVTVSAANAEGGAVITARTDEVN